MKPRILLFFLCVLWTSSINLNFCLTLSLMTVLSFILSNALVSFFSCYFIRTLIFSQKQFLFKSYFANICFPGGHNNWSLINSWSAQSTKLLHVFSLLPLGQQRPGDCTNFKSRRCNRLTPDSDVGVGAPPLRDTRDSAPGGSAPPVLLHSTRASLASAEQGRIPLLAQKCFALEGVLATLCHRPWSLAAHVAVPHEDGQRFSGKHMWMWWAVSLSYSRWLWISASAAQFLPQSKQMQLALWFNLGGGSADTSLQKVMAHKETIWWRRPPWEAWSQLLLPPNVGNWTQECTVLQTQANIV